jgi:hypothetical protein
MAGGWIERTPAGRIAIAIAIAALIALSRASQRPPNLRL